MYAVGIDIGGTHTRVAAVEVSGRILAVRRHPTRCNDSPEDFIRLLAHGVDEVCAEARPSEPGEDPTRPIAIGLAVPGLINQARGAIIRAVNLPHLEGYPLMTRLSELTNLPVTLLSDADAATWGEYVAWTGQFPTAKGPRSHGATKPRRNATRRQSDEATKGTEPRAAKAKATIEHTSVSVPYSFVHLRLGTGIACGWVNEGRLQSIEPNRTGHLSMLVIDDSPSAGACRCGKRGCLDTVASGHVLSQRAQQLGFREGLPELERAYGQGHAGATARVVEAADGLSKAITNIADGLHPEVISLGGGVLRALPSLQEKTFRCLEAATPPAVAFHPSCFRASVPSCLSPHRPSPIVAPALLGDDAGLVGAASLVMRKTGIHENRNA